MVLSGTRPKAEMNPSQATTCTSFANALHVSCSTEMQAYLGQSHTMSYMSPSDSTRGSVQGPVAFK